MSRSRPPTLWVVTDQTATSTVYVSYVRRHAGRLSVQHEHMPLIDGRTRDPAQRAREAAEDLRHKPRFDPADGVLVLMDWENDLLDPQIRTKREQDRQRIARAFVEGSGVPEAWQVHVRLVPPTTEGLYLLWMDEFEAVDAVVRSHIKTARAKRLSELVAKRARYAHTGSPPDCPTMRDINLRLGSARARGRRGPKSSLADDVAHALTHTVSTVPKAPCLQELDAWVARMAAV